ncbi:MAG: hypothetical protein ABSF36_06295 [Candidatus Methanomethylicaceae archaeon]
MIILLSGDGKFLLEGKSLDTALESGRQLFSLLREDRIQEFSEALDELHSFVKQKGQPVEIYHNADIIVPPVKCDPRTIQSIMGFQKTP